MAGRRNRQGEGGRRRGLKVLKTLGLYLRDGGPTGKLVRVDDPRFDPMWDACGRLGLPVAMHVGDPEAFFSADRSLQRALRGARRASGLVVPRQGFPGLQGDSRRARPGLREASEDDVRRAACRSLGGEPRSASARCSTSFPNVNVEIGARIGELGRQPRTAARFFDKYQDRILFGTDAIPLGVETPQQVFGEELYRIYYRFLETEDEYFDYAPAPVPPQGRWRIYGVGLPEPILRKVYHQNAERVLGMKLVGA